MGGGGVVAGGNVAGGKVAGGKVAGGNVAGGNVGGTVVGTVVVVVVDVVEVVVVVLRVVDVVEELDVVEDEAVVVVVSTDGFAVASPPIWVSTIARPSTPAIPLSTMRPERLSSQLSMRVSRSSGLRELPLGLPMSRFAYPSQPAPPAGAR